MRRVYLESSYLAMCSSLKVLMRASEHAARLHLAVVGIANSPAILMEDN
jgi:hypothetical protein